MKSIALLFSVALCGSAVIGSIYKDEFYQIYLNAMVKKNLMVESGQVSFCGSKKFEYESVDQLIERTEKLLIKIEQQDINKYDLIDRLEKLSGKLTKKDELILIEQAKHRYRFAECVTGEDYNQELRKYKLSLKEYIK
ncbi:hypothetical protein [Vibrio pelagius]|uniref:hypothetical protein n=1 Tax=Vibrio pelagius TaxID=28169 RepID=UPI0021C2804A|nr:hypothetical protein [Vibrio pelagius]